MSAWNHIASNLSGLALNCLIPSAIAACTVSLAPMVTKLYAPPYRTSAKDHSLFAPAAAVSAADLDGVSGATMSAFASSTSSGMHSTCASSPSSSASLESRGRAEADLARRSARVCRFSSRSILNCSARLVSRADSSARETTFSSTALAHSILHALASAPSPCCSASIGLGRKTWSGCVLPFTRTNSIPGSGSSSSSTIRRSNLPVRLARSGVLQYSTAKPLEKK
mmetsp:Transcript_16266/g.52158  ORF Transcript_16266/g.52158 Transcript_16266/m.52158 type:complete len:225 (+) Transcript_16266:143-817(+)